MGYGWSRQLNHRLKRSTITPQVPQIDGFHGFVLRALATLERRRCLICGTCGDWNPMIFLCHLCCQRFKQSNLSIKHWNHEILSIISKLSCWFLIAPTWAVRILQNLDRDGHFLQDHAPTHRSVSENSWAPKPIKHCLFLAGGLMLCGCFEFYSECKVPPPGYLCTIAILCFWWKAKGVTIHHLLSQNRGGTQYTSEREKSSRRLTNTCDVINCRDGTLEQMDTQQ